VERRLAASAVAQDRVARQGDQHLTSERALGHRREGLRHDPHAEEDEAEAEHDLAEALGGAAAREEAQREANPDEEQRELLHLEGDELHRERRADVRAQDHTQGLAEGEEARGNEADQHQGGCRRGLDERGDEGARAHRGETIARHAREDMAKLTARRTLESLAAELHAVQEQGEAAEEAQEHHG